MYKLRHYLLCFVILVVVGSIINVKVNARTFDESIKNIYELRNVNTWLTGYNGSLRPFAADGYTHGYYLGTTNQFLPYKVASGNMVNNEVSSYDYALFCTLFGASSPAKNSASAVFGLKTVPESCIIDNSWDIGIQAGVGSIINNVNPGDSKFSGQQLQNYYDAEIAINQFLYDKLNNSCNITSTACDKASSSSINEITSYNKDLVALANATYDKVIKLTNNKLSVVYPDDKKLYYSKDEEIWKSQSIKVDNLENYSEYTLKAKLKGAAGKENYAYITKTPSGDYQVGVCNGSDNYYCKGIEKFTPLEAGSYTVEVTISAEESFEIAQNYSCGSEFQTVTPAFTNTKIISDSKTATFEFNVEEEKGSLTIKKVDENGIGILGATITIVSQDGKYNNNVILEDKAKKVLYGLDYGTYTVTETKAPNGYVKDNNSYEIVIDKNNPNPKVTIKNIEEKIEKETFRFYLIKVDEDGKELPGADFNITYGSNNQKIEDIDSSGILSKEVEVGTRICIEETSGPSGYKIVQDKFCFKFLEDGKIELDEDYQYVEVFKKTNNRYGIKVTNLPEDKSITYIKKIDADTNKLVKDATLQVINKNGNVIEEWVTTDKEYMISGLKVGTYYIEEIEAPEGYSVNENKVEFQVDSNQQIQTIEFKNTPLVKVPNTLANTSKLLIVFGVVISFIGGLMIYKNNKQENI